MTLAQQASRYYNDNDNDALFRLAADSWPGDGAELPEGIAEVCRFAFIRAVQLQRVDQYLWRARALTAAVITGARDTAAGLLLQPFFVATSFTLENGAEKGHEQARLILEEMKRLVPEDTSAWSVLFARLYHEKKAFSFLMEATSGGRPEAASRSLLDAAEAEYALALDLTPPQDSRGALKVRGGLALVRYLRLACGPQDASDASRQPYLEETEAVRAAAAAAGYRDVEGWATANVEAMGRGEFIGWTAYEVV